MWPWIPRAAPVRFGVARPPKPVGLALQDRTPVWAQPAGYARWECGGSVGFSKNCFAADELPLVAREWGAILVFNVERKLWEVRLARRLRDTRQVGELSSELHFARVRFAQEHPRFARRRDRFVRAIHRRCTLKELGEFVDGLSPPPPDRRYGDPFVLHVLRREVDALRRAGPGRGVLPLTGCWCHEWDSDYRRVWTGSRSEPLHRLMYEFMYGRVPDGYVVGHQCDVRPCFRPSHLFLTTQAGNMADMAAKGRASVGRRSGVSVLELDRAKHEAARSV